MGMMNTELYDALLSADVPEIKARKAAMSILGHDQVATKADIAELRTDIAEIKADIRALKWMLGVNMAMTTGLIMHAIT